MSHYRAMALHIGNSCYNCSHFLLDETMLYGQCCRLNKTKGALGTCKHFHIKSGRHSGLSLPLRSTQTTR